VDEGPSRRGEVNAAICSWEPIGVSKDEACFARAVVTEAAPGSVARARALLLACSRLAAFGASLGLEPVVPQLLRHSVIERFVAEGLCAASASTRRTIRTNLRFVTRAVAPGLLPPDPPPLRRHRAKAPYSSGEIAAYLALADAQPTLARQMALSALVCLGAGAGLIGADLRHLRGRDVTTCGEVVVVSVRQGRARVVPVLGRFAPRLMASASYAEDGYLIGGRRAERHNVTATLLERVSGGADLARLQPGRLRASWLAVLIETCALPELCAAAGISDSKAIFDLIRAMPTPSNDDVVALLAQP
jgi:hypothetical protein